MTTIRLTKKTLPEIFPNRTRFGRGEYEYIRFDGEHVFVGRDLTLLTKILVILTFPVSVVWFGPANFRKVCKDTAGVFKYRMEYPLKTHSDTYERAIRLIRSKGKV